LARGPEKAQPSAVQSRLWPPLLNPNKSEPRFGHFARSAKSSPRP